MSEIHISPQWCSKDFTPGGRSTWATEVSASLACANCRTEGLGVFMWPPMDSELIVGTAREAIKGATGLALSAAQVACPADCTIICKQ